MSLLDENALAIAEGLGEHFKARLQGPTFPQDCRHSACPELYLLRSLVGRVSTGLCTHPGGELCVLVSPQPKKPSSELCCPPWGRGPELTAQLYGLQGSFVKKEVGCPGHAGFLSGPPLLLPWK